jgi:hypothetical protein
VPSRPSLPLRGRHGRGDDPLERTDAWFLANGLSYFVPEKRTEARAALSPRRTVPRLLLVALVAAAAGGALAWVTGQFSAAPAVVLSLVIVATVVYALTVLHARPIVTWALARTVAGLRSLLPLATRALPLLLVFVTFLFINAEVWQLAAELETGALWLVVLLFAVLAVAFLAVRLPEEVDKVDDEVDDAFLVRACAGTPLEGECARLVADPDADPASYATVTGFERANLVAFMVVIQAAQVLLMAGGVLVFFLLFGALTMGVDVQSAWTGLERDEITKLPYLVQVSVPLGKVSLFLAAFSLLYLAVSTVTDDTYREQFFGRVTRELERAVGVRAVYLALRAQRDTEGPVQSPSSPGV